jgi:uncharacterized protein YndB with AHSA1/START domain
MADPPVSADETVRPLQIAFTVDCPQPHAWQVWTGSAPLWWPADHTVSGAPGSHLHFEPYVGGRVFERTALGEGNQWGAITVWEPPARLAYTWHIGAGPEEATDVEITFVAERADRCRVQIEHRGWERLGATAAPRRLANQRGWDTLLPHYRAALAG